MHYAQIRTLDISNGEGVGIALYTTGCPFHCKNCFNSELWNINVGKEWDNTIQEHFISLAGRNYINRISILGGEPFIDENLSQLEDLVRELKQKYPQKKIWAYSGFMYEDLLKRASNILSLIDVLVDGKYIDELKDMSLRFRGSSNQRVIDVQKSLKKGEVIYYL